MLGGYLEFFMNPALANTYISLKRELEELIHNKVCIWLRHLSQLSSSMHLLCSSLCHTHIHISQFMLNANMMMCSFKTASRSQIGYAISY